MRAARPQAGETPAEAAARNVLRELKVDISPKRFKYLCHASLLWQFRHQEPKGDPKDHSHDDSNTEKSVSFNHNYWM